MKSRITRIYRDIRLIGSGFTRSEIDSYSLNTDKRFPIAHRFLSNSFNKRVVRPALNSKGQSSILEDKFVFCTFLSALGIPVPHTYLALLGSCDLSGALLSISNNSRGESNQAVNKVVLKPRGGRQGRSVFVLEEISDLNDGANRLTVNGRSLPFQELVLALDPVSYGDYTDEYTGWILQEYIDQHHDLSAINKSSVNTVRLVTLLDSSARVAVIGAALRVGRRGSYIDNCDKGGVSVEVDLESGRCGSAVAKIKHGGTRYLAHPDSGVEFSNIVIPYWTEILRICCAAARFFPSVRSIGWDVACGVAGPFIIEANSDWGLASIQSHSQAGLLSGVYGAKLSELGIKIPESTRGFISSSLVLANANLNRLSFI